MRIWRLVVDWKVLDICHSTLTRGYLDSPGHSLVAVRNETANRFALRQVDSLDITTYVKQIYYHCFVHDNMGWKINIKAEVNNILFFCFSFCLRF